MKQAVTIQAANCEKLARPGLCESTAPAARGARNLQFLTKSQVQALANPPPAVGLLSAKQLVHTELEHVL